MSSIIQVENLSKSFTLRHEGRERYTALRDVVAKKAKTVFSFPKSLKVGGSTGVSQEEFWALKDVSFNIGQGDRVGIIGRNGAGKSTLLKILSRITEPTDGSIKIKGRVASLLEVGTGFHPELTGRENIFLNGAILGMSRAEVKMKFDEIVDFAEVEKFLDTPVKRYSSGMYVRLAFAVAAHLEPEILVVDEVLAVGDAQFQKKCLGKMEEVSTSAGRTILFVSHNMTAMQNFCNKGIFLQKGSIKDNSEIASVIRNYLNDGAGNVNKIEYNLDNAPGTYHAKFIKAEIVNGERSIDVSEDIYFEFSFYNLKDGVTSLDITFHLYDELGQFVFVGSSFYCSDEPAKYKMGFVNLRCRIPKNLMHEGHYTIYKLLLVQDRGTVICEVKNVLSFEVKQRKQQFGWMGAKEGVVRPILEWDNY